MLIAQQAVAMEVEGFELIGVELCVCPPEAREMCSLREEVTEITLVGRHDQDETIV